MLSCIGELLTGDALAMSRKYPHETALSHSTPLNIPTRSEMRTSSQMLHNDGAAAALHD